MKNMQLSLNRMMDTPKAMTDHPEQIPRPDPDDTLSEILAWVRLRGGRVFQTEMSEPYALRFDPGASYIHVVERGPIRLITDSGAQIDLAGGDVVLIPHGTGHQIVADRAATLQPISAFAPDIYDPVRAQIGPPPRDGSAEAPVLVGGQFHLDRAPLPPLLARLPEVIKVSFPNGILPRWLTATTFFLTDETANRGPGSALMLSRIVELMVIRMLREWAANDPTAENWLGANRDERLGRALSAIHSRPAQSWSVSTLAAEAGMSRSVFADKFFRTFGEPPLRYLTRWRFALASDLLQATDLPIGQIARKVGYASEPGFSRAFKAMQGHPPSSLRQTGPGADT